MRLVPDPLRAGPGRQDGPAEACRGRGCWRPGSPSEGWGQGIPQVRPLWLGSFSVHPHHLQAKEAPNLPPATPPGARWEKGV